jgi:hypothetical protein
MNKEKNAEEDNIINSWQFFLHNVYCCNMSWGEMQNLVHKTFS